MKTQNKKQVVTKTTAIPSNDIAAVIKPATDIITVDNVKTIGERIAIRALKTVLTAGGKADIITADTTQKDIENFKRYGLDGNGNAIRELYNGLIRDINENKSNRNATYSDGYDIAQNAIMFLYQYNGKPLDYIVDTDKNGNAITVKKACFRAINRYIMNERNRTTKTNYLEDNGNYVAIPKEWDAPTITDYKVITEKIQAMNLTDRQQKILSYRLRGKSIDNIADILEVSRQAILKTLTQIQEKYNTICGIAKTQTATTLIQADKNKNAYNNIDTSKLTKNEKQLYAIYQDTQSITKTATALNKSRQAVQNALKRMTSK